MKTFGGFAFSFPTESVETPRGEACAWCGEVITASENGVVLPVLGESRDVSYHGMCFLRTVVGSVGHQAGECSCHGGETEDPPHMTRREAASAAVLYYQTKQKLEGLKL